MLKFKNSPPTRQNARTRPRTDLNGEPCALVKIAMPTIDDIDFKGNIVSTIIYRMGMYNVYITAGAKRLTYQHKHYYPGVIDFEEAGITISPITTYSVVAFPKSHLAKRIATLIIIFF